MKPSKGAEPLDAGGVARALDHLRQMVRARGLKASSVRDTIARAALTQPGHFRVEDLLRALPDTHAATVYRVMPVLLEAGLVQVAPGLGGDGQRYERAFERDHHDHLVCTSCHEVVEFEFEAIELLQRDIAERFGFSLTGHVHQLFGLCEGCCKGHASTVTEKASSSGGKKSAASGKVASKGHARAKEH
jgi:Fur family ferric uptake transcriptional regulator